MAVPLTVGKFRPMMPTPPGGGGFQPGAGYTSPYLSSSYTNMARKSGGQFMPFSSAASQAAPQAAPPPTITLPQGTPAQAAFTPDYSSMIGSSWEVGAAEAAMGAQMAAARAQFQNQLRQSFIDLGFDPGTAAAAAAGAGRGTTAAGQQGDMGGMAFNASGKGKGGGGGGSGYDLSQYGDLSKYLDKDTIQKAIDNKFSAYAQIKQQEAKSNAYNDALLAARGGGTSGTATATTENTLSDAEQARYTGLRNFLSGGQEGLSNLANLKAQLAQGVLQARFAAAQRLAAMYPPTPAVPATSPNWDDFWGSYQGGVWAMPGQGNGWIVPAGNATPDAPSAPWWVGPGSGVPGDLSWLNPHV